LHLRRAFLFLGISTAAVFFLASTASGQDIIGAPRPPMKPEVQPKSLPKAPLRKVAKPTARPRPSPKAVPVEDIIGEPLPSPMPPESITSDDFGDGKKAPNATSSGFRKGNATSCSRGCIRSRSRCEAAAGKGPGRAQRLRACRSKYRACAGRCG